MFFLQLYKIVIYKSIRFACEKNLFFVTMLLSLRSFAKSINENEMKNERNAILQYVSHSFYATRLTRAKD